MNTKIIGDNIEVTDKVKDLIDKKINQKIDQLLPHFNDEIKTATMRLEKDKYDKFKINFDMVLPGKDGRIYAEHQHEKLITALTGLREQVEKQIKKYKGEQVNYSLG